MTKCGKCGGASWELAEIEPNGSDWKYQAIQCASCKVAIAVTDYFNLGAMIQDIKDHLGIR